MHEVCKYLRIRPVAKYSYVAISVHMYVRTDFAELILQELSTNIPPDNLIFFPSTIMSLLLAFRKISIFIFSVISLASSYQSGKPSIITW